MPTRIQTSLKLLYTVTTTKGYYDNKDHIVVVMCDDAGTRYVWHTTTGVNALSALSPDNFVNVKCTAVHRYECGDIIVERVTIV